jgi:hypothetical protein
MRKLLHILTKPADELAAELVARHQALAACSVRVVDLTQPVPNYQELLEALFEADSVQVW